MPSYIIKASPDEDFYVEWSTVVDAPCRWGTAAALAIPADRLARADERGTSADWEGFAKDAMPFGWSDETFIVMEVDGLPDDPDSYCVLPRANLRELCRRLDDRKPVADLVRVEAFEDA